ncbi:MAG: EscU/YscU/HrcU family type III secretion system export apparatus switch protein [Bdellovibrionales bacterium]|nr:EscU/YscU/HrcU family type III secretion system export apparatus switch protein [Bdellovibrionales bacterium]
MRLVASAIVIVFLFFQSENIVQLMFTSLDIDFSNQSYQPILVDLSFFLLSPVLIVFFTIVFVGLLQTKFLFKPSLCAPDSKRFSGKIFSKKKFSNLLNYLIFFFLGLVLAFCFFWSFASSSLALLNNSGADSLEFKSSYLLILIPVVLVICAFFSWILALINFMQTHRMSRREMLMDN